MSQVEVKQIAGGKIAIKCPYSLALIDMFKVFKGKWDKPYWTFDDRPLLRDMIKGLWGITVGVDPQFEVRVLREPDLIQTGGQVMAGGYVLVGSRYGKPEVMGGVTIHRGAFIAERDGSVSFTGDIEVSIAAPVGFDTHAISISILPPNPPKAGRGKTKAPTQPVIPAPTYNIPEAHVPVPVDGAFDRMRDAITLTLAFLENGNVHPRMLQEACRKALGWTEQPDYSLVQVTDLPVPEGSVPDPRDGTAAAPVRLNPTPATGDPFDALRAMFG
jgi:hypothetical protein